MKIVIESEMHNYKSPIKIVNNSLDDFIKTINENYEDKIVVSASHILGVEIDKQELLRALLYDRQQYDKGFIDGYKAAIQHLLESEENYD